MLRKGLQPILAWAGFGHATQSSSAATSIDNARISRAAWALLALALAVRLILWKVFYKQPFDDAYIYLHYAKNFATGHGLVYNPGERIIGYTSPLYMMLESLSVWVSPLKPENTVQFLNLSFFAAAGYFLIRLIDPSKIWHLAILGVLLFFFPFIDATLNGMETSLYLALILATFTFYKEDKPSLALVPATLAALTRPEGIFLVLALLVLISSRSGQWRRIQPKHVAVSVVLILAWVIPAYLYYGTFIPHSMLAKSQHITSASWAGQASTPAQKLAMLALGVGNVAYTSGANAALAVTLAGLLVSIPFLFGFYKEWKERSFYALAGVFFLLVLAFYILGNPVRIWSWYVIPSCLAFLLVASRGLQLWSGKSRRRSYVIGFGLAAACVLSFAIGVHSRKKDSTLVDGSPALLSLSADTLARQFPESKSVMVGDVGLMAYRTKMRIIDLAGLVSEGAMKPAAGGRLHILGDYIAAARPDIICIMQDPLKHAEVEQSMMRYRSFASFKQRDLFRTTYAEVSVTQPFFYRHVFVRRSLLGVASRQDISLRGRFQKLLTSPGRT